MHRKQNGAVDIWHGNIVLQPWESHVVRSVLHLSFDNIIYKIVWHNTLNWVFLRVIFVYKHNGHYSQMPRISLWRTVDITVHVCFFCSRRSCHWHILVLHYGINPPPPPPPPPPPHTHTLVTLLDAVTPVGSLLEYFDASLVLIKVSNTSYLETSPHISILMFTVAPYTWLHIVNLLLILEFYMYTPGQFSIHLIFCAIKTFSGPNSEMKYTPFRWIT